MSRQDGANGGATGDADAWLRQERASDERGAN